MCAYLIDKCIVSPRTMQICDRQYIRILICCLWLFKLILLHDLHETATLECVIHSDFIKEDIILWHQTKIIPSSSVNMNCAVDELECVHRFFVSDDIINDHWYTLAIYL